MKKVLIVIPTYNEVDNIRPLIAAINSVFQKQSRYIADILFVDDNSPDGTSRVIKSLQTDCKNIHLISDSKEGLGKAYIRGLTYGMNLKPYYAIVTMDADLSHDPKDISKLLAQLESGADFVIGSRYVSGGHIAHNYPFVRKLQSTIANYIAKRCIEPKNKICDLTSGFKAIRAARLSAIPLKSITASGYVFQVSLLYEFSKRNYKIREVPISFNNRIYGSSKLSYRDSIEFLYQIYRLNPNSQLRRLIRFVSVGLSGTLVNLAVLIGLVRIAHFNVILSYIIALEISILSNFCLNHWFTFRSIGTTHKEQQSDVTVFLNKLFRYNVVSLGGVAISWLIFSALYHELHLGYVLADILGIAVATSWNYWMSIRLVWKIVDTPIDNWAEESHHQLQKV